MQPKTSEYSNGLSAKWWMGANTSPTGTIQTPCSWCYISGCFGIIWITYEQQPRLNTKEMCTYQQPSTTIIHGRRTRNSTTWHEMSGSSVKTTNLKPSVASKVRQQTLTKWCGSCRTAAYCCQQCRAQVHTSRETLPKRRILRSNLFWRSCVLYTIWYQVLRTKLFGTRNLVPNTWYQIVTWYQGFGSKDWTGPNLLKRNHSERLLLLNVYKNNIWGSYCCPMDIARLAIMKKTSGQVGSSMCTTIVACLPEKLPRKKFILRHMLHRGMNSILSKHTHTYHATTELSVIKCFCFAN